VVRVDLLLGFLHANDMIGAPRQRGGECFHDLVMALFPEPGSVRGGGVIWRALAEAGESVVPITIHLAAASLQTTARALIQPLGNKEAELEDGVRVVAREVLVIL
jgi:hypothetical protein